MLELNKFLSFNNANFNQAFELSKEKKFDLIICDISPLGLEIAFRLGIPSVLIENFTWGWIYEEFSKIHSGWTNIIRKINEVFDQANLHIQAKPFCLEGKDSFKTPPISRCVVKNPNEIKESLGCNQSSTMVLLTTGGITKQLNLTYKLKAHSDYTFIVSGDFKEISKDQNIISLPMNSHEHYPDIVNASSLVVGKVGYGTLSECWATNCLYLVATGIILESGITVALHNLTHIEISIEDFENMNWISEIQKILQKVKIADQNSHPNGASLAAMYIRSFIN